MSDQPSTNYHHYSAPGLRDVYRCALATVENGDDPRTGDLSQTVTFERMGRGDSCETEMGSSHVGP